MAEESLILYTGETCPLVMGFDIFVVVYNTSGSHGTLKVVDDTSVTHVSHVSQLGFTGGIDSLVDSPV